MDETFEQIISQMTLEEKAGLCSGADFWHLKSVQRLGVPTIMVTDGPHGLRKESGSGGISKNVPATCFPTASATASSWDRDLLREVGAAMAEECLQEGVSVILGPGANIKRSPLCGRNFEYFSEDPYLSGGIAAAMIEGIQSQGVGASLKHFAVNNQEYRRMTIDAVVDERALREIYLAGYEFAVKMALPWTVMCSYNRLDGTYASENERLLTRILRDEWGYKGVVVTDWGACNDRVAGLKAGQDLEMPASGGVNDKLIVEAVKSGRLDEAVLNQAVERILGLIARAAKYRKEGYRYDPDAHHALARRAAAESAVLLKNEGAILPLKKEQKIALIGAFARSPRYQGTGSSFMNPTRLDNAHDELAKVTDNFSYSAGYPLKSDLPDEALIEEACAAARAAEVALIFAGLPDSYESEGLDRDHLRMPESHNLLIQRVAQANPNLAVVLSNGAPVEMPWAEQARAILEGYLGGQAGAGGVVDLLFGAVNPSGKLAETFPYKLEDTLSSSYFPSGPKTVEYRESLFVGYRYFDSAHQPVRYPFGHGLSYTKFTYSNLSLSAERIQKGDELAVTVTVENTGPVAGAEIVQLYVRDVDSTAYRPAKELKGFNKVFLQPGEKREVIFSLDSRSFAFYNPQLPGWQVESGAFEILLGASSADIRVSGWVWYEAEPGDALLPDQRKTAPFYYNLAPGRKTIPDADFRAVYGKELPVNRRLPGEEFDINTPLSEIKDNFVGKRLYKAVIQNMNQVLGAETNEVFAKMAEKMADDLPLRNLVVFSNGQFTLETVNGLLKIMNGKPLAGIAGLVGGLFKKK